MVNAESDCRIQDIHTCTHFLRETSENRAGRMNGKRAVVKQVGGTMNQLQIVDEIETGILALQIYTDHSSSRFSKLLDSQLMERIILQTHIVDTLDFRQSLEFLCQF